MNRFRFSKQPRDVERRHAAPFFSLNLPRQSVGNLRRLPPKVFRDSQLNACLRVYLFPLP